MRLYTETHKHYCGVDLHARSMYVCILDPEGEVLLHRNMPCDPKRFLRAIAPYREDLVVVLGAEHDSAPERGNEVRGPREAGALAPTITGADPTGRTGDV